MPNVETVALAYQIGPAPTVAAGTYYPVGPFNADGSGSDKDNVDAVHEMLYRASAWQLNVDSEGDGEVRLNGTGIIDEIVWTWEYDLDSELFSFSAFNGIYAIPTDEDAFRCPVPWDVTDKSRWFALILGTFTRGTCTGTKTIIYNNGDPDDFTTETTDCTVQAYFIWGPENATGDNLWPIANGTYVYPKFRLSFQIAFNFVTDVYPNFPGTSKRVTWRTLANLTPPATHQTDLIDFVMNRATLAVPMYHVTRSATFPDAYGTVIDPYELSADFTTRSGSASFQLTATPTAAFTY